jgi:lipopolysaccharide transport system ATP-binding protein
MSNPAIRAEGLGKRYRIGAAVQPITTAREALFRLASAPLRNLARLRRLTAFGEQNEADVIWALRDVSFELAHGEVLGMVGHNGAGKSTLLKILSRITSPTVGRVTMQGRVGSLLEVGVGFKAELTGRDNIFLNGSILGMDRRYIKCRFDEIVDFADVGRFIDTPVKRYSSGMYMRLAFAVAAHLEPEILIIDEVLAVGDAEFQRRCLGKMGDVAREGRTVVFVSHNMVAVQDLCTRAIWMDRGTIRESGTTHAVVTRYLQDTLHTTTERVWDDRATAPGNERLRMHSARVRPRDGSPGDPITVHTPLEIEVMYYNLVPGAQVNVNLQLFNAAGILLFEAGPTDHPIWRPMPAGLYREICQIPGDLLNNGPHRVVLKAVNRNESVVYADPDLLGFDVLDSTELRDGWYGEWGGAVRPVLDWQRAMVQREAPALVGG